MKHVYKSHMVPFYVTLSENTVNVSIDNEKEATRRIYGYICELFVLKDIIKAEQKTDLNISPSRLWLHRLVFYDGYIRLSMSKLLADDSLGVARQFACKCDKNDT